MGMVIHDSGELAGKSDIPINVVTACAFHFFIVRLMQPGGQANSIAHGLNIADALRTAPHARIAQAMLARAKEVFASRLYVVERDHRFANLVCGAGTVANVKVVQRALANPTPLLEILPLEPYENKNWIAEHYETFFAQTITWRSEHAERIEICGVICDNLPAQVIGLLQVLRNTAGIIPPSCRDLASTLS
jgi:hypothetical protein